MGLFVASSAAALGHGVFALKQTPPTQIRSTGSTRVGMVGAFPWGPEDTLIAPASMAEAKQLLAPRGFTRTGYGYLSLLCAAFPDIEFVRVLGSSAAKATSLLLSSAPATVVTLTAKYKGVTANSFTAVVSAALDADANHFDLTVTMTGASGTTVDTLHNLNFSGTGSDTTFSQSDLDKLELIGAPVKTLAGRPVNGTYTFSGGLDGTINSAAYIGTPGQGDKGIAILEGDGQIRHVFCDYPGSGAIAAVNAALVAHKVLMGDRSVYLTDLPSQAASHSQSDVAAYRGAGVLYADPWIHVYDDVGQVKQLVPSAPLLAALNAQLSPSTSAAWKASEVRTAMGTVVDLEYNRGSGAITNEAAGISTLIPAPGGGFVWAATPCTIAPQDPTLAEHTTWKMDVHIARSFVDSVYGTVDSPNVAANRDDVKLALEGFMAELKVNKDRDANHLPHVIDYQIMDLDAANTPNGYAAGDVYLPLQVQYSNGIKRLFLVLKSGTAQLTVQAA